MNYKGFVDVSIEYAHTYLGKPIGKEHEQGAMIAKYLKKIFEGRGDSTSLLLLIDDYNSGGNKESYSSEYIQFLESFGIKPTHLMWESDCVEPAKKLLEGIPTVKPGFNEYGKYEKDGKIYVSPKKGKKIKVIEDSKYKCPLLAAASEASQLGLVNVKNEALTNLGNYSAKTAVIVLPISYEGMEIQAGNIIELAYSISPQPIYHFYFSIENTPSMDQVFQSVMEQQIKSVPQEKFKSP